MDLQKEIKKLKRKYHFRTFLLFLTLSFVGIMSLMGFSFLSVVYHEYQHKADVGELLTEREMCLYAVPDVPLPDAIRYLVGQGYFRGYSDSNSTMDWESRTVNTEIKAYAWSILFLLCGLFCMGAVASYASRGLKREMIEDKIKLKKRWENERRN